MGRLSKFVRELPIGVEAFDRPLLIRGHDEGPVPPKALHANVADAQERAVAFVSQASDSRLMGAA